MERQPIVGFSSQIGQSAAKTLPRFRAADQPRDDPTTKVVYAFPFRRAPWVLVIGADHWTVMPSALFGALFQPSCKEAREIWARHTSRHDLNVVSAA